MKNQRIQWPLLLLLMLALPTSLFAYKKKVAQAGMTYLSISLGARESALGDATVASVRGIQGLFYNQATLADIEGFALVANQVNWLVDTKLYGIGAAYSLGDWGTIGLDLVYMDYGVIQGTRRVDKSIDERGFELTGDLAIQDYAVGISYAYRISDRFAFGGKVKIAHEDLGEAAYATDIYVDPETGQEKLVYETKRWKVTHLGFDFGGLYYTGYKSLAFAFAFQNFSTDIKFYAEEFQMPLVLRMGLSADLADWLTPDNDNLQINFAVDALHPNDNLERVYVGTEVILMKKFAIRGGYKFNHDVESYSFGMGINFSYAGMNYTLDYAYGSTNYFKDVSRFSLKFSF
ncbi:MAG: PorV/PorQ family protein [candidate division KSB1 bacterium]|nr:PorV/PorQ family protein [candidate division KSB1 bacterium]MDQ7064703.1 PorV/PorQ family protein [candidate division KSB1 bacterium]